MQTLSFIFGGRYYLLFNHLSCLLSKQFSLFHSLEELSKGKFKFSLEILSLHRHGFQMWSTCICLVPLWFYTDSHSPKE